MSAEGRVEHQKLSFWVFNSIGQLISLPSDEVYRVGDGGPDHAVVLHVRSLSKLPFALRSCAVVTREDFFWLFHFCIFLGVFKNWLLKIGLFFRFPEVAVFVCFFFNEFERFFRFSAIGGHFGKNMSSFFEVLKTKGGWGRKSENCLEKKKN